MDDKNVCIDGGKKIQTLNYGFRRVGGLENLFVGVLSWCYDWWWLGGTEWGIEVMMMGGAIGIDCENEESLRRPRVRLKGISVDRVRID